MIGTGLTVMLLLLVYFGQLQIRRVEGALLLLIFVGYMGWVTLV